MTISDELRVRAKGVRGGHATALTLAADLIAEMSRVCAAVSMLSLNADNMRLDPERFRAALADAAKVADEARAKAARRQETHA